MRCKCKRCFFITRLKLYGKSPCITIGLLVNINKSMYAQYTFLYVPCDIFSNWTNVIIKILNIHYVQSSSRKYFIKQAFHLIIYWNSVLISMQKKNKNTLATECAANSELKFSSRRAACSPDLAAVHPPWCNFYFPPRKKSIVSTLRVSQHPHLLLKQYQCTDHTAGKCIHSPFLNISLSFFLILYGTHLKYVLNCLFTL